MTLLSAGADCTRHGFDERWTLIEVRDSTTGAPLANVLGVANGTTYEVGNVIDPGPAPLAPTNSDGRTFLSIVQVIDRRTEFVNASIEFEFQGNRHTTLLPIKNGAESQTENLIIRVLDTDAEPPPPPQLEVSLNSRPVEVIVNGYIYYLAVCSNSDNRVTQWVQSSRSTVVYVASVILGSAPVGFEVLPCFRNISDGMFVDPCPCPVTTSEAEDGFSIFAYPASGTSRQEWIRGETFCLDGDGAAIECP